MFTKIYSRNLFLGCKKLQWELLPKINPRYNISKFVKLLQEPKNLGKRKPEEEFVATTTTSTPIQRQKTVKPITIGDASKFLLSKEKFIQEDFPFDENHQEFMALSSSTTSTTSAPSLKTTLPTPKPLISLSTKKPFREINFQPYAPPAPKNLSDQISEISKKLLGKIQIPSLQLNEDFIKTFQFLSQDPLALPPPVSGVVSAPSVVPPPDLSTDTLTTSVTTTITTSTTSGESPAKKEHKCARCFHYFKYLFDETGKFIPDSNCTFHPGRIEKSKKFPQIFTKIGENTASSGSSRKYTCCGNMIGEADNGCSTGSHIWEHKTFKEMQDDGIQFKKTQKLSELKYFLLAIDCEMIFTTHGHEVARGNLVQHH